MIQKPLKSIEITDLQDLVDNSAAEGLTLEYKRDAPGGSDGDRVKFLKAVTGMANTNGGDLIYGIDAVEGLAHALPGFATSLVDQTLLRLESFLQTCVEPRIPTVAMQPINVSDDKCVLVVRTQRSWLQPHRVNVGNHVQFYGRSSASTYPLDVSQLREAFLASDRQAEQLNSFVVDRLLKIEQGRTPVELKARPKMVLHIIPVGSLSRFLNFSLVVPRLERTDFHLFVQSSRSQKPNLDGFVVFDTGSSECNYYTQVFRNGIVEAAESLEPIHGTNAAIHGGAIEHSIIGFLRKTIPELTRRGVPGPFIIQLSFANMIGCQLLTEHRFRQSRSMIYRDPMLILPNVALEDPSELRAHELMRPVFDAFWNAFEQEGSPHYDEDGNWRG